MAVRFRKSFRLGGVKLNVTKNGLSSISLGGRGASFNIPVARSGGIRGTAGIPGSGLSYSHQFKTQRPSVSTLAELSPSKSPSTFASFSATANTHRTTATKINKEVITLQHVVCTCLGFVALLGTFAIIGAYSPQKPPVVDSFTPSGTPGDCSGNRWMSPGCTYGTPGN